MLGRRALLVLGALPWLLAASLEALPREGWASGLAGCALLALAGDNWLVIGAGTAAARGALERAVKGVRAKADLLPSGADLTTPPGRIRVRGVPRGLCWVAFRLDPASKKHTLLQQVFAKSLDNVRWG